MAMVRKINSSLMATTFEATTALHPTMEQVMVRRVKWQRSHRSPAMLSIKEQTTFVVRREIVREERRTAAPKRIFPANPIQGDVDYEALRKRIVDRFPETIARLGE